jgi:hydroxymethylglutaryl-CoA lyase
MTQLSPTPLAFIPPSRFVECPRDSWQGLSRFIPSDTKVNHLLALIEAGFTHLDCVSFVSPKAVPQMQDSTAVASRLPSHNQHGVALDYLAIIGNERGLIQALACPTITSVGFPLSVSESFQQRNLRQSLNEAWDLAEQLYNQRQRLRLVVYLSFAFGNPYGDHWDETVVLSALEQLQTLGITEVALADTMGQATASQVYQLSTAARAAFPGLYLGLHLHARREHALALVTAGIDAGIGWFEGALAGVGGCPFAGDALVGNLPSEIIAPALGLSVPQPLLDGLAAQALQLQQQFH